MIELLITPRDPVIARDGRPFSFGQRVKSLDWIYPSVFIGSLRTMLGKQLGFTFDEKEIEIVQQIELTGPLPFANERLYFPKPLDCVAKEYENDTNKGTVYTARPIELNDGEGSNLPQGLQPVLLPNETGDDFKPKKTNPFWSADKMLKWLMIETCAGEDFDETDTLQTLPQEERVHVQIEASTGASEKRMLFSTTGLDFNNTQITVRVNIPDGNNSPLMQRLNELNALHPLGGERRLVHWEKNDTQDIFPQAPSFADAKHLRMVLATPAIFANGYLPGWIDEKTLIGTLPNSDDVKVKLAGAIVDRWRSLSGWCYEKGKQGPKPVRRLVPAGSVYFFEIQSGTLQDAVRANWLKNVCDGPQNNRDGFGLSLWGIW